MEVDASVGSPTDMMVLMSKYSASENMSASTDVSLLQNMTGAALTNLSESNKTINFDCYGFTKYTNHSGVMTSHYAFMYLSTAGVVLGLVGNMLSVLVFTSREMRVISSNFYLLMLAVSDSLYLVSVFLAKVLTNWRCLHMKETPADIYNRSQFMCKLLQYTQDVLSDYSTCLILLFTIERFIAVYMPLKFKEICTLKKAQYVCLGLLAVIAILTFPYHVTMVGLYKNLPICIVLLQHEDTFTVLYFLEMLIFRIIPVVLIAVLNAFIINKVIAMSRNKKKRTRPKNSINNNRAQSRKDDKNKQLTVMLILVSSTYVLTYLPVLIHYIIWKLARLHIIHVQKAGMLIAQNYVKTLYIYGFAINFFLYTMSGKVFREQLIYILCGQKKYIKSETSTIEMTTVVKET